MLSQTHHPLTPISLPHSTLSPHYPPAVARHPKVVPLASPVTMQEGEMRAISEVTVGDRVLAADVSGETLFSEVVFVPHGDNKESAPFGHIRT